MWGDNLILFSVYKFPIHTHTHTHTHTHNEKKSISRYTCVRVHMRICIYVLCIHTYI